MTYDLRKQISVNIRGSVRACERGDKILIAPYGYSAATTACSDARKTGNDFKIEWAEDKTYVIITKL